MPTTHAGRTVETCQACHKPATATTPVAGATPAPTAKPGSDTPDALPADHAGRTAETCLMCHGPAGAKPMPTTTHAGRTAETCLVCHKPK